jgi:putative tryptophan/tyrosine transport system substrate-binding protein
VALGLLVQVVVSEAQHAGKVWRIGFISVAYLRIEESFFQHLRELGYVEGQNLVVERRYSEGRAERFPEFAAGLARANLDLLIVTTTPAALAVKSATRTIPVVLPNSIDPVGTGLVASLARPGGNMTGTTSQAPELFAKRLQLLAQAIPHLSTVAVVWNAANPANARSWREVQGAVRGLGIKLQSREVRVPADFERVFAEMARERPDALLLIGDRLTLQHGDEIVEFATQRRIPTMLDRAYPETAGALLSYGAEEEELWRRPIFPSNGRRSSSSSSISGRRGRSASRFPSRCCCEPTRSCTSRGRPRLSRASAVPRQRSVGTDGGCGEFAPRLGTDAGAGGRPGFSTVGR